MPAPHPSTLRRSRDTKHPPSSSLSSSSSSPLFNSGRSRSAPRSNDVDGRRGGPSSGGDRRPRPMPTGPRRPSEQPPRPREEDSKPSSQSRDGPSRALPADRHCPRSSRGGAPPTDDRRGGGDRGNHRSPAARPLSRSKSSSRGKRVTNDHGASDGMLNYYNGKCFDKSQRPRSLSRSQPIGGRRVQHGMSDGMLNYDTNGDNGHRNGLGSGLRFHRHDSSAGSPTNNNGSKRLEESQRPKAPAKALPNHGASMSNSDNNSNSRNEISGEAAARLRYNAPSLPKSSSPAEAANSAAHAKTSRAIAKCRPKKKNKYSALERKERSSSPPQPPRQPRSEADTWTTCQSLSSSDSRSNVVHNDKNRPTTSREERNGNRVQEGERSYSPPRERHTSAAATMVDLLLAQAQLFALSDNTKLNKDNNDRGRRGNASSSSTAAAAAAVTPDRQREHHARGGGTVRKVIIKISSELRARSRSRYKSRERGGLKKSASTCAMTTKAGSPADGDGLISPPLRLQPGNASLVLRRSSTAGNLSLAEDDENEIMREISSPNLVSPIRRAKSQEGSTGSTRGAPSPCPSGAAVRPLPFLPPPPPAYAKKNSSPGVFPPQPSCGSNGCAVPRKPPPPPPRRSSVPFSNPKSLPNPDTITQQSIAPYVESKVMDPNRTAANASPGPPLSDDDARPDSTKRLLNRRGRSGAVPADKTRPVTQMAYTDPYGDYGLYTGEVDDESRPHGRGKMKFDNGVYYEGNWIHGYKDDGRGQSTRDSSLTRERILSGFTSWKGQRRNTKDGNGSPDNGTFVYGMDWVDLAGLSGKYTGNVDKDDVPHGRGVMKYEFGLIAEGDWIKGVLNDRGGANGIAVGAAAGAMSVAPGMSVAGGGAASMVSGLGMMSIGGGLPMGWGNANPYHNPNATAVSLAASYYNLPGAMGNAAGYQQNNGMIMMNHQQQAAAGGVPTNMSTVQ